MSIQVDPRRPQRQDTYDLRDQMHSEDHLHITDAAGAHYGTDEEEHSVLEDDSEQGDGEEAFEDDDMSSTLSIPNESIDFDMVYALHSFAATVEGQANVVKGDSLYLMDDSNSYWWLVRVLKTQEVGYIPAENIETPFERLARLNKHRNIDLATATQTDLNEGPRRLRVVQDEKNKPPSPSTPRQTASREAARRTVHWTAIRGNYLYIPALREGEVEEEDDEWEVERYEDEDLNLAADLMYTHHQMDDSMGMDADGDDMQWEDIVDDPAQGQHPQYRVTPIPDALQPASQREQEQQRMLRMQQQQQLQQQHQMQQQEQQRQEVLAQQQAQAAQQAAAASSQQTLQPSGSRERLALDEGRPADPAEVTETRKMTATPTIAREYEDNNPGQVFLPSQALEKQREEERLKRQREDDEETARKKAKNKDKMAAPVSSATYNKPSQQPAKLRKEPAKDRDTTDDEGKDKKKKTSVFGGLFSRSSKKEKSKEKGGSVGSVDSSEYLSRTSEDSTPGQRPSTADGSLSPTTSTAHQQQQALRTVATELRPSSSHSSDQFNPHTPERAQVSQHASQLRQRDQQQQALYQQQYLNRSPSSPPEASFGLQSASAVFTSPSSTSGLGPPTPRARPGSLILTSPSSEAQASLNVIRVFAGKNLQTEATFKTVLLNPSTTSADLVKQSLQRFRLPSGEDEGSYYLTIKQVEGGVVTVLQPPEHPLVVFENIVSEAELPKVKRSSVGSISSVSSNLSMHPAIKKLSMNDFTDDSAVKFYLNRRGGDNAADDSMTGHEGDDTMIADISHTESDGHGLSSSQTKSHLLAVNTGGVVAPERFTSPSIRFPLQLVIYAEDLPDDMQFHPETEAIVFKRSLSDPSQPILVSPTLRRKVFMFPKNITVAEVTEIGLERFGIQDGVVDGGDEVEDKGTKRRSVVRVRYGLAISIDGQERELGPSGKVIDAFHRPPVYRPAERNPAANKRRSMDATQILGSIDDVRQDDPVFILRRATSYRNSTSRRRMSAPLDEIALQHLHLHRESTSSYNSESIDSGLKQPSRQEIIAAQRAAQRATQHAIVTSSTNSVRGMDVLLPGNVMLRSSRYETDSKMRYSYVEDGETYDVSDIIEEEWRDSTTSGKNDLLEGVLDRNKDGIGEKLDRMLSKIRKGKAKEKHSSMSSNDMLGLSSGNRSVSPSEYSFDDTEVQARDVAPLVAPVKSQTPTSLGRDLNTPQNNFADRTITPTVGYKASPTPSDNRRGPSVGSVQSNYSERSTPPSNQTTFSRGPEVKTRISPRSQRHLVIPKDDFGLSHMLALIDFKASQPPKDTPTTTRMDPVDELLFGATVDLESLHPSVRDIYASGFKQLEEMDKVLDGYIAKSVVGAF